MNSDEKNRGGENFNLLDILKNGKELSFVKRVNYFSKFVESQNKMRHNLYMRQVVSPADREVEIIDHITLKRKKMLMFGSNNYLGLANHPYVQEKVQSAIQKYGVGISGPPLLNGYTLLHRQLEERLSAFKHAEDTLIFPTGYSANVGMLTAIVTKNDLVIYDAFCHASFHDGLKMGKLNNVHFAHNDLNQLENRIEKNRQLYKGDVFVGVEGVYSMDGDLAPLDKIVSLCKKNNVMLILDDAHGSGVMGKTGCGTAEHFGVSDQIDITMGTFSKTFGVVGGFISSSKPVIDYMRFFARSYMFSASLPPAIIAAVLAGLDVIEREPELIQELHKNVKYAAKGFQSLGFDVEPEAAIIALKVPETMNIRKAAFQLHQAGVFVNSIEYPAVPLNQQKFRISMMASHTKKDIDYLLESVQNVWEQFEIKTD